MTKFKNAIKSYWLTNLVAEFLLDIKVVICARVTGSYTKCKEDLIAKRILMYKYHKSISKIKYIDIGANNFRRGNNSYLFYKEGARGILIEADTFLCKKLKERRKGDKVFNVAVGTENCKSIDFYVLSLPTRSTLDKDHMKSAIEAGLSVKKIIKVPCVNLDHFLEEQHFEPDYMSIDIEGMDYKVLRSIDFGKHSIKVIVAEICNEKSENGESMNEFMNRCGYDVYGQYESNVIYVKKD